MPRNKSERVPHPEVPRKFHERRRLWATWGVTRNRDDQLAYRAQCDLFTQADRDAYNAMSSQIHNDLTDYYSKIALDKHRGT